jgi:hypothetical protein
MLSRAFRALVVGLALFAGLASSRRLRSGGDISLSSANALHSWKVSGVGI